MIGGAVHNEAAIVVDIATTRFLGDLITDSVDWLRLITAAFVIVIGMHDPSHVDNDLRGANMFYSVFPSTSSFALGLLCVLTAPSMCVWGNVDIVYSRDIAPILTTHCYSCHGPDSESRKADLRLDRLSEVISASESETTILNPGRPELSELLRRITTDDPDVRMPPPEHADGMARGEIDFLNTGRLCRSLDPRCRELQTVRGRGPRSTISSFVVSSRPV